MKIVDKSNMSSVIERIKDKFVAKEAGKGLSEMNFSIYDSVKLSALGWYVDLSANGTYYDNLGDALDALPGLVNDIQNVTMLSFSSSGGSEDISYYARKNREADPSQTEAWSSISSGGVSNLRLLGIPSERTYTAAALASELGITKGVWNSLKNLSYNFVFIEDSGMIMCYDYSFLALPAIECLQLRNFKIEVSGISFGGDIINIYTNDEGVTYKCEYMQ